jgi:hypothetical protein
MAINDFRMARPAGADKPLLAGAAARTVRADAPRVLRGLVRGDARCIPAPHLACGQASCPPLPFSAASPAVQ